MLLALLIVYILNFLDRQIINILAEPIKGEPGLSSTPAFFGRASLRLNAELKGG
jgi:hypothetical protein